MWNESPFLLFKFSLVALVLLMSRVVNSQYGNPFVNRNPDIVATNTNTETDVGQRLTALEAKMDLILAERGNSQKALDMFADVLKLIMEINKHNNELTTSLQVLENRLELDQKVQEELLLNMNQTILDDRNNHKAALHVLENKVESEKHIQVELLTNMNQTISNDIHNYRNALHGLENKVKSDNAVLDKTVTSVNHTILNDLYDLKAIVHELETKVESDKQVFNEMLTIVNQTTILNQEAELSAVRDELENKVKSGIAFQKQMLTNVNQTIVNQQHYFKRFMLSSISDKRKLGVMIQMLNTTLQNSLPNIFEQVAFSACLSHDITKPVTHLKIIFDVIISNIGNGYNSETGIFTVPSNGLYVFHWTIVNRPGSLYNTELVVNGQKKRGNAADSGRGGKSWASGSSMVTLSLIRYDKVWIRKWGGNTIHGNYWPGFSGFRLA